MSDLIMRVLVADDEAPFREELASINWCDYGCEFVGAASNGQEALMMCIEFIPHIIITDITMPVMDGLDVLKQVHYSFPQVKTVLLTCHEDFSFVKEAIALGAVDYILKRDLCTQEILRVINKCRNLIEQESFINSTKRMNQRKLLLKYLMAHKEGLTLDLCQTERYFRSIPFMPAYGQNAYFLYAGSNDHNISMYIEVHTLLEQSTYVRNWIQVDTDFYAILFTPEGEREPRSLLSELSYKLRKNLYSLADSFSIYLVKERDVDNLESYVELLQLIKHWQAIHFYYADRDILTWECYSPPQKMTPNNKHTLMQLINECKYINNEKSGKLENWLRKQLIWPVQLKKFIVDYLLETPDLKKENFNDRIQTILNCDDVSTLISLLQYILHINNTPRLRIEIRNAISIIKNELSSKLTLTNIAERVNLSPQYLGKLFSEALGESFHQYVTRMRIDKAKQLLQESDLLVYEVAEQVGIPNYRYFSTLYKKMTGKTPKDVRNGNVI